MDFFIGKDTVYYVETKKYNVPFSYNVLVLMTKSNIMNQKKRRKAIINKRTLDINKDQHLILTTATMVRLAKAHFIKTIYQTDKNTIIPPKINIYLYIYIQRK